MNFKNIEEAELHFSPKINYLFGNNGMGKTNLLDALYYLSFTKSYSNLPDSLLIRHDADFCLLQGNYRDGEREEEIHCGIRRKQKKVFSHDKKEYDRLSEHIGRIPLVMISPEDGVLIQGGSEGRRKFVDMVISQYDKEYLRMLILYNRTLMQRNSLLRNESSSLKDPLFDILEEQMAFAGEIIFRKREDFAEAFLPLFRQYHRDICGGNEEVELRYDSGLKGGSLTDHLFRSRERDKALGYTGSGVHKDDFLFLLDDYLIRKIGSQGQNKTYLIALKLAQFTFLSGRGSSVPILLLDDIFDKLDAERVEKIIRLVSQTEFNQIFLTDTNRKYLDELLKNMNLDHKLFRVEQGRVEETE